MTQRKSKKKIKKKVSNFFAHPWIFHPLPLDDKNKNIDESSQQFSVSFVPSHNLLLRSRYSILFSRSELIRLFHGKSFVESFLSPSSIRLQVFSDVIGSILMSIREDWIWSGPQNFVEFDFIIDLSLGFIILTHWIWVFDVFFSWFCRIILRTDALKGKELSEPI